MTEWFFKLSTSERFFAAFLVAAFVVVMAATLRGMLRSPWTWYRGVQSTPLFQIVMWLGAFPLVIPAIIIISRRSRGLKTARFIGNLNSHIYHCPSCEYQQQITFFFFRYPLSSHEEARAKGFRPCRVCRPK